MVILGIILLNNFVIDKMFASIRCLKYFFKETSRNDKFWSTKLNWTLLVAQNTTATYDRNDKNKAEVEQLIYFILELNNMKFIESHQHLWWLN